MADISVGMKVSGVSTFVSSMKQSQASLKQFDAELKLAEAEFEANGNAQQKMAKQTTTLKKKLEEQKKAVEECKKALEQMQKNGVQKTSEAWKSWETALTNNQTALVSTQNRLSSLNGSLGTVSNKVKQGTKATGEYSASLKNIQTITNFKAVADGIGSITSAVTTAISGVINLGRKLWNLEAEQTYWADDILTRATTYSMDAEELQRWEYAARFVDTEASTIMAARNRLMKQYKNEFYGTLEVTDGEYIQLRESNGQMRDTTDIFWDTLGVLSRMTDETKRDTRAQELFGQSWADLLPLMIKGRAEWERLGEGAPIISNEDVEKLGDANDALQEMEAKFEALQHKIAVGFAPAFTAVAESLSNVFDRISEWISTPEGQAVLESFSDAIVEMLNSLTDEDFKNVADTVKGILDGIVSALGWVVDNKDGVKTALEVIGVALAGLKIAETTVKGLQLLNGIKNLTGGTGTSSTGIPTGNTPTSAPSTDVATGAGAGAGGLLSKLKTAASKVGDFAINWGPELLGAVGSAWYTAMLVDLESSQNDPHYIEARNLSQHLQRTGYKSPTLNMDTSTMSNEDMASVAATLSLYEEERNHEQSEAKTGYEWLSYVLWKNGALNRNLTWEDQYAYMGNGGINGEVGTGFDWSSVLTEEYMNIGGDVADGISQGVVGAESTLNSAGAAAAAALTSGFAGYVSSGHGGGFGSTTGNVYIGNINNTSTDTDLIEKVRVNMSRSLAGYGGGRK